MLDERQLTEIVDLEYKHFCDTLRGKKFNLLDLLKILLTLMKLIIQVYDKECQKSFFQCVGELGQRMVEELNLKDYVEENREKHGG